MRSLTRALENRGPVSDICSMHPSLARRAMKESASPSPLSRALSEAHRSALKEAAVGAVAEASVAVEMASWACQDPARHAASY